MNLDLTLCKGFCIGEEGDIYAHEGVFASPMKYCIPNYTVVILNGNASVLYIFI